MTEGETSMQQRWASFGMTLLVCFIAAQPAQAQSATAESLFQEGKTLMKEGQYEQACPKLEESYRQDPATGALLALAMCHEKQGRLAAAWAEYIDVASRAKQEGRKDREDAARKSAEGLFPRLSQLTLKVDSEAGSVQGLEVRRDRVVVGRGAWGAPMPVDSGQHKIEVSAPGRESWSAMVAVGAEGDRRTVQIPVLRLSVSARANAQANAPAGSQAANEASLQSGVSVDHARSLTTLQIVGIGTMAAGAVGLGLGTFFGINAMSGKKDTDAACPKENCSDQASYDKRQDAVKAGNVSTIAFVAGGVLAATGATLFIFGKQSSVESGPKAQLTPFIGVRNVGVVMVGQF